MRDDGNDEKKRLLDKEKCQNLGSVSFFNVGFDTTIKALVIWNQR